MKQSSVFAKWILILASIWNPLILVPLPTSLANKASSGILLRANAALEVAEIWKTSKVSTWRDVIISLKCHCFTCKIHKCDKVFWDSYNKSIWCCRRYFQMFMPKFQRGILRYIIWRKTNQKSNPAFSVGCFFGWYIVRLFYFKKDRCYRIELALVEFFQYLVKHFNFRVSR